MLWSHRFYDTFYQKVHIYYDYVLIAFLYQKEFQLCEWLHRDTALIIELRITVNCVFHRTDHMQVVIMYQLDYTRWHNCQIHQA